MAFRKIGPVRFRTSTLWLAAAVLTAMFVALVLFTPASAQAYAGGGPANIYVDESSLSIPLWPLAGVLGVLIGLIGGIFIGYQLKDRPQRRDHDGEGKA